MPKVKRRPNTVYQGRNPQEKPIRKGQDFGGYSVVTPGPAREISYGVPLAGFPGERLAKTKPWNKTRPKATGRK